MLDSKQANRYEQRVKQLEKDLRDKGSTSEENKIPKTWKESPMNLVSLEMILPL